MQVNVYTATCSRCGFVAYTHARNVPPGCSCSLFSKKGCDGVLGPWKYVAWVDVANAADTDTIASVTMDLGNVGRIATQAMPGDRMPASPDIDDLDYLRTTRDYFAAESKRNADAARTLNRQLLDRDKTIIGLHEQIRDKDGKIEELREVIKNLSPDEPTRRAQMELFRGALDMVEFWKATAVELRQQRDQALQELEKTRQERNYNAKQIDSLTNQLTIKDQRIAQLRHQRDDAIRKLHE